MRRKEAPHEPCARRVVDMTHIAVRAENVSRIKPAVLVQVQMILFDELLKVCRAEVRLLRAEGIFEVERIHAELVRVDDDADPRDACSIQVVAADSLEPPDLVFVVEGDAVGFIGAVLLQKRAEAQHALSRGMDVGQDEHETISSSPMPPQRPSSPSLASRSSTIGSAASARGFDVVVSVAVMPTFAALMPVAAQMPCFGSARAGRVAHGVPRQFDFHMGQYALINIRLLVGLDRGFDFHIKTAVVCARDHRQAVVRRQLTGQYSGAGHNYISVSC